MLIFNYTNTQCSFKNGDLKQPATKLSTEKEKKKKLLNNERQNLPSCAWMEIVH